MIFRQTLLYVHKDGFIQKAAMNEGNESAYRYIGFGGVAALTIGIITICVGIITGTLLVISGTKLLQKRSGLLF